MTLKEGEKVKRLDGVSIGILARERRLLKGPDGSHFHSRYSLLPQSAETMQLYQLDTKRDRSREMTAVEISAQKLRSLRSCFVSPRRWHMSYIQRRRCASSA